MEPSVVVYSRKSDVSVVEDAASNAAEQYKETSGRDIKVDVKGSLSDDMQVKPFSFTCVRLIPHSQSWRSETRLGNWSHYP